MAIPELPPEVREHLSRPIQEPELPDGARVVTGDELAEDLSYKPGSRGGDHQLRVEAREDPMVPLKQQLSAYGDRRFFYAGLLYGYCRLDASITERFRADMETEADTRLHQVGSPLVEIPAFPDFSKTRVSRLLQSVEVDQASALFDFIVSQVIVDRPRNRVWAVEAHSVRIPDPYMADGGEVPQAAELLVFCPKTYQGVFLPRQNSSFFVSTPSIVFEQRPDEELARSTEAILGG